MRVLILIEGKPDGRLDVSIAADKDWRRDPSQALPAQRLAAAAARVIQQLTVPDGDSGPGGHLRCSFCGKGDHQVAKIIAGPCVYICNECIELCSGLLSHTPTQGGDDDEHGAD